MIFSGQTRVCGVIGHPISHSASPAMHNAGYEALGLDRVYVPFLVAPDQVGMAVQGIKALGIDGVNVTVPYKEAVIPFLDELDVSARHIKAVNTIVNRGGKLVGYNTDGEGFLVALRDEAKVTLDGKHVVIIGAGGAARGIAFALLNTPIASLTLLNRSIHKAELLARDLNAHSEQVVVEAFLLENQSEQTPAWDYLAQANVVIQCTSVGMSPELDKSPVTQFDWVKPDQFCCDIIYKPAQTVFLKQAQMRGAQTLNGAGMLAGQGVLAFELMTGHAIPYPVFREQVQG